MANKKYGTITMRNEMLIQFANELNYKKIIPMHYEDYSHY